MGVIFTYIHTVHWLHQHAFNVHIHVWLCAKIACVRKLALACICIRMMRMRCSRAQDVHMHTRTHIADVHGTHALLNNTHMHTRVHTHALCTGACTRAHTLVFSAPFFSAPFFLAPFFSYIFVPLTRTRHCCVMHITHVCMHIHTPKKTCKHAGEKINYSRDGVYIYTNSKLRTLKSTHHHTYILSHTHTYTHPGSGA